ncbi:Beta-taxilin, partial [Nibea albiflora]
DSQHQLLMPPTSAVTNDGGEQAAECRQIGGGEQKQEEETPQLPAPNLSFSRRIAIVNISCSSASALQSSII